MENKKANKIRILILITFSIYLSLFTADSVLAKTREEFLARFEELKIEEQQNKKMDIECAKNPESCLTSLTDTLAIDENGDIEGANLTPDVSSSTSGVGVFVEKIKQALTSLGIVINNGIAQIKELVAEKITATKRIIAPIGQFERIEMRDKITGEIYCTWLENGEWVKVKSPCEEISNPNDQTQMSNQIQNPSDQNSISLTTEATTTEATSTLGTSTSTEPTCTPNWQCGNWQPLPETVACGETFTQTRTCTDSNTCGTSEGKPAETQETTGNLCLAPSATGTCQEGTCSFICQEGYLNCINGWSDGCEFQLETPTSTCPSTEQKI